MAERVATRERERQGEEQRALEARRGNELKSQATLATVLRERRAERERREQLLEEAFGAQSLFAKHGPVIPVAASALAIEALAGLPGGPVDEAWWGNCVPGGYPDINGLVASRPPRVSSYVVSLVQVLLRVPSVAVWLGAHVQQCVAAATVKERIERCAACALWHS